MTACDTRLHQAVQEASVPQVVKAHHAPQPRGAGPLPVLLHSTAVCGLFLGGLGGSSALAARGGMVSLSGGHDAAMRQKARSCDKEDQRKRRGGESDSQGELQWDSGS